VNGNSSFQKLLAGILVMRNICLETRYAIKFIIKRSDSQFFVQSIARSKLTDGFCYLSLPNKFHLFLFPLYHVFIISCTRKLLLICFSASDKE